MDFIPDYSRTKLRKNESMLIICGKYYNSNNVLTRTFESFLSIVKLFADLLTNRNGDTCFIIDYS